MAIQTSVPGWGERGGKRQPRNGASLGGMTWHATEHLNCENDNRRRAARVRDIQDRGLLIRWVACADSKHQVPTGCVACRSHTGGPAPGWYLVRIRPVLTAFGITRPNSRPPALGD